MERNRPVFRLFKVTMAIIISLKILEELENARLQELRTKARKK